MVGQKELLKIINKNINDNTLPHFITLCGPEGCGKHTLCTELSRWLNTEIIFVDNKVDSIRATIDMIYSQTQPIIYVFENADAMSINSKNSLLKVCEEPPQSAFIILLTENKENILPTILSRTQLYEFSNYTPMELNEYFNENYTNNQLEKTLLSIACSPGDINKLMLSNNSNVYSFAVKVVNNLGNVSLSNALKIPKQISLTKTADGFDYKLFLNSIINVCKNKFFETRDNKYLEFSKIASKTKHNLSLLCVNKNYELDDFIIKGWLVWNYQN